MKFFQILETPERRNFYQRFYSRFIALSITTFTSISRTHYNYYDKMQMQEVGKINTHLLLYQMLAARYTQNA